MIPARLVGALYEEFGLPQSRVFNPTPGHSIIDNPEVFFTEGIKLSMATDQYLPSGHRTGDWFAENWKDEVAGQGLARAMAFRSIPYFGWVALTLDAWTFAQYLEYD